MQTQSGIIPGGLPGGFFIYESGGEEKILFAEENVIKMFGCTTFQEFLEYVNGSFTGMVHPDDLHKIENEIQAQTMFGEKRHDYVRYKILTKQGEVKYIEDFGHLLHGSAGKSYFYVFIVDVDRDEYLNRDRNSFAEAQLLSMNQETDPLTGLFNMSFFYQNAQSMVSSRDAYRQNIAFIHFDIPNFKLYNERYGFMKGDELLCELAKILKSVFAEGLCSRFSDDHFVVCVPQSKDGEAKDKVSLVFKLILNSEEPSKRVRIKAGIYYFGDRYIEVGLACDHARLACNSIKGRHDINVKVYDEMLRERLRKQQYVADHVDDAIENHYLNVYYQPVIRTRTGEICGYEALVRWIDPVVGFLSPADFIDTLEQFHLIHVVDGFVVRNVCRDLKTLHDAGEDVVPVSLNISRLDFELCDIFDVVKEAREEYGIPARMLDIEITESALNDNSSILKDEIERFREAGHSVWLDDFGSGYSSLNVLTEYSLDVLKLDLVFLRSYDTNEKTRTLMTSIMEMARALDLAPLTEGVETKEHYEFLKSVNCERAQGYYFGKPQPIGESRKETMEKGMKWEKVVWQE